MTIDTKMYKGLGGWIEPVEGLIASYPYEAGAVLEKRIDEASAETIRLGGVMREDFASIAVISTQSLLSTEP